MKKNIKTSTLFLCSAVVAVMLTTPFGASAATSKPTCSLKVVTQQGSLSVKDDEVVVLKKGEAAEVQWTSKNAEQGEDEDGNEIPLTGVATTTVTTEQTFEYTFIKGSKSVSCEVTLSPLTGSITTTTLKASSKTKTVTGLVTGLKKVYIKISKEGSSSTLYTSKAIKVSKGKWTNKITKKLPEGTYVVSLYASSAKGAPSIASTTLVVGDAKKASSKSNTTLVVEPIPLLFGGTARAGEALAVAYVQVLNIGKEAASIKGFTVVQNGSTPTSAIASFTSVDDTGLIRGSTGTLSNQDLFKNKEAFVPIEASFEPGQMRLFTIKAVMQNNVSLYAGTQLLIDLAGVDANAKLQGTFPARGTTWTVSY